MSDRFTAWVELRRAYEATLVTMAFVGVMGVVIHQSSGWSKLLQKAFEVIGILYYVFAFAFSLLSLYSVVVGR